jgi:preprotein translocase subunit SecF
VRKPVLVGILIFAALIALIAYSTMSVAAHRVEVCIQFKGQTNCRTAAGATNENALRKAVSNACADMSSGVTEVLACERSEPTKINWLK